MIRLVNTELTVESLNKQISHRDWHVIRSRQNKGRWAVKTKNDECKVVKDGFQNLAAVFDFLYFFIP